MPGKDGLEKAIQGGFNPLEVALEFPDGYSGRGDRLGFAVRDDDGREVYRSPERRLGYSRVESWIEEGRKAVEAAGYQLEEWEKASWFAKYRRSEE